MISFTVGLFRPATTTIDPVTSPPAKASAMAAPVRTLGWEQTPCRCAKRATVNRVTDVAVSLTYARDPTYDQAPEVIDR
jgi:hypothetical protein